MPSGGKREGAGRKPSLEKKVLITAYVSKETRDDYTALKSAGVTMDEIIAKYTGKSEQ